MEAILETIPSIGNAVLHYKLIDDPYFPTPYHFHSEIEILLVTESYGTLYVGDGLRRFRPGDVALIGSEVPHWWNSHEDFYQDESPQRAKGVCLQFQPDRFFPNLFATSEGQELSGLFRRATRGLWFTGNTRRELGKILPELEQLTGMARLLRFLEVLHLMNRTKEVKSLCTVDYRPVRMSNQDQDRLNKVFDYVTRHYADALRLEDVASLVNLTPPSFSRLFKVRTNKPFSRFLNEVRISKACERLIDGRENVSEIAFHCGFNQLSNFNRQFKAIKGVTPREFRARYTS